jgi:hypothetical protein
VLGFEDGQSVAVSRVPAFDDWQDFIDLLIKLIPDIPSNLINASYDPTQKLMLFNFNFGYQFDPIIPQLLFNETFEPLGDILSMFVFFSVHNYFLFDRSKRSTGMQT